MSLVGSLEDLDLGDILQIIHLSRKSGALQLQSSSGQGSIVFSDGLIATAFCKGGPEDLRELLQVGTRVDVQALDAAADYASARGRGLEETLLERSVLDADAIDLARRGLAEEAVLRMFGWRDGEFSFEVREIRAADIGELFIDPGLNPQFLALEGTRQFDESEHDLAVVFDGEPNPEADALADVDPLANALLEPTGVAEPLPEPTGVAEPLPEPTGVAEPLPEAAPDSAGGPGCTDPILTAEPIDLDDAIDAPEAEVEIVDDPVASVPQESAPPAPALVRSETSDPAIIVIDSSLPVLEWVKTALESNHSRIHVFQTSELGISRIRQYLARRELPLVLISADAPADTLSGAQDTGEIVRRLRTQAPRMPILVMSDQPGPSPSAIRKPSPTELADPRAAESRLALGQALRVGLGDLGLSGARLGSGSSGAEDASVVELREFSARIRDPGASGKVLGEVLRFATRSFQRVALFMVRDGDAIGLAQQGLPDAGGPDDAAFRGVVLPIAASPWLQAVIEAPGVQRIAAAEVADPTLATLLGGQAAEHVFLAPIESSGSVVAVVYADSLPEVGALPNTAALEVVLDQAGLALDRATLERVLEEG